MSRVALLGGSFNPPHFGHQMLALWALGGGWVDAVWLLPCGEHAFGKKLAPFADRVRMCELALEIFAADRISVCTIEGGLEGPSRTQITISALQQRHPEHEFSLLMGADLLEELPRWYRVEQLLEQVSLLVAGRPGAAETTDDLLADERHLLFPQVQLLAVTSTEIRRRIAHGEEIAAVVPRAVREHIEAEGLYRDET